MRPIIDTLKWLSCVQSGVECHYLLSDNTQKWVLQLFHIIGKIYINFLCEIAFIYKINVCKDESISGVH